VTNASWCWTSRRACRCIPGHAALLAAQAEFAAGRAHKTYWAVVRGAPSGEAGTIDAPLARRSTRAGWHMVTDPAGKQAATDWRVLGRAADIAWLELAPRTGRTHQVRVHCALLGCPVLGDALYGGGPGPLHLLARAIALDLDPKLAATAPVPAHMRAALVRCGMRQQEVPGCATMQPFDQPDRQISSAAQLLPTRQMGYPPLGCWRGSIPRSSSAMIHAEREKEPCRHSREARLSRT